MGPNIILNIWVERSDVCVHRLKPQNPRSFYNVRFTQKYEERTMEKAKDKIFIIDGDDFICVFTDLFILKA